MTLTRDDITTIMHGIAANVARICEDEVGDNIDGFRERLVACETLMSGELTRLRIENLRLREALLGDPR